MAKIKFLFGFICVSRCFFLFLDLWYVKNRKQIITFGTHVRKLREERGMSQQQLADMSDVSKLTIQRTELAKFSVTIDVMISISKGLEVDLKELVDFDLGD